MGMKETVRSKARDALLIVATSRLFPNKWRQRVLRFLGWRFGVGCTVHWGLHATKLNVHFGNQVFLGRHAFLDGLGSLDVGDFAAIGPCVRIITTTHPIAEGAVRQPLRKDIDTTVRIGRGCWLGAGVTVLPGVSIAEGCVIGAGAVVSGDTSPNGLYVGVPARRVKDLPLTEA